MVPARLRRGPGVFAALAVAALASAPGGCAPARRQVMLSISTNASCDLIDRVTVRLSRGAGSTAYTYQGTFRRSDCSRPSSMSYPQVPLAAGGAPWQLGVVDGRRTDDRLRIEVEGLGTTAIRALAETDFVDDKVYAVPIELADQCVAFPECPSGYTCRVPPGSRSASCGSVYRSPGTLGRFMTASMIVELDGDDAP